VIPKTTAKEGIVEETEDSGLVSTDVYLSDETATVILNNFRKVPVVVYDMDDEDSGTELCDFTEAGSDDEAGWGH